METTPYLIIRKLLIEGPTNQYETTFNEGLNFIWGDMDSGKSSILNLIDYCLGGKNDRLLYAEMKKHGRVSLLEIDLNGRIFTLERDILYPTNPVRVYPETIEKKNSHFPQIMSASSSDTTAPDGWLSDFLLDNLNIPRVSIKESRYRDDASSDRLSFRDLMKLLYLRQPQVGAESLMDFLNGAVFNKNVEIQKFVFNIYDDQLTELTKELARAAQELNELVQNERFIRKFLIDINIDPNRLYPLDDDVEKSAEILTSIDEDLSSIKEDFILSSELSNEIMQVIRTLSNELQRVKNNIESASKKYDNFAKLNNTYSYDLESLKTSKVARQYFNGIRIEGEVPCPLCSTAISVTSPTIGDEDLESEIRSLRNRISGVDDVLNQLRKDQQEWFIEEAEISAKLIEAKRSFDENNITYLSPLVSSIQALESARTNAQIRLADAQKNSRIANKYIEVTSKLDLQNSIVTKLKRSIKIAEDGLKGLDEVIAEMTGFFQSYIKNSGLQNNFGAYIDKRFVAHFRDISYYNTSSGGVKTIASIGTYLSRLMYILKNPSNLPTFLMIDTPGQNIGRYRKSEDSSDVSDPQLYENIFKQILQLTTEATRQGRKCQIIVVDNDIPNALDSNAKYHLAKQFSKHGGEVEKGLISDAQ